MRQRAAIFGGLAGVILAVVGCAGGLPPPERGGAARPPPLPPASAAPVHVAPPKPEVASVVRDMPAAEETSIPAVARYIAARVPDHRARIKALHDWVADRVTYDPREARVDVLLVSDWSLPLPDPPTVRARAHSATLARTPWSPYFADLADQLAARAFKTRRGVCASYAALLAALGEAAGENIPFVVGDARTADGAVGKHVWNVARLDGHEEPIDVTWDSGYDDGSGALHHVYSTAWLFVPPAQFLATHVPDDARWKLVP